MQTLNLGILAHVDAGKTTLTERLLYTAGVIDEVGSVDAGTTQTDSLALERQRGITIKSAVVSFTIDDVTINLIDTPGHPDFIAEVERALSVLDGAVLVISAVEGVQPQTRILMRALQRLRVPTLLFVNKIDRAGAGNEAVLRAISTRLTPAIVAMGATHELGTRNADFTPWDGTDRTLPYDELAAQTKAVLIHPVFFGSAITGAGVRPLLGGITTMLPARAGNIDEPALGRVFKIERGRAGEKIAYVRMFSGTVRTRDRLRFGRGEQQKVTAINLSADGATVRSPALSAGQIGTLWGLTGIQIGDAIGESLEHAEHHQFAPPALETVVVPTKPNEKGALRRALAQLAEQDPLINVRQDDVRQEISVSLYGEVQKEVIEATLATDYGIAVTFRETTTVYIERPTRAGEAIEVLRGETNPFSATIGLRVEPAPIGSCVDFRLAVDPRQIPLHIYKTVDSFVESMTQHVDRALQAGLYGWQVTDCVVTMFACDYYASDGSRVGIQIPRTTAADFRKLTPRVLLLALEHAGSVVCEPITHVSIETPSPTLSAVLTSAARNGAAVAGQSTRGDLAVVEAVMPASRVQDLRRQLPGLTGGEAVVETSLEGYRPVKGRQPRRKIGSY